MSWFQRTEDTDQIVNNLIETEKIKEKPNYEGMTDHNWKAPPTQYYHIYRVLCHFVSNEDYNVVKKDEIIKKLLSLYEENINIEDEHEYATTRAVLMSVIYEYLGVYSYQYSCRNTTSTLNGLIDFYNRNSVGKENFSMNEKVYPDGSTDLITLVKPNNWGNNYPNKMPKLIHIISEIKDLDLTQENNQRNPAFLQLVKDIEPWFDDGKRDNNIRQLPEALKKEFMLKTAPRIKNMLNTASQLITKDKTASFNTETHQHLQNAIRSMITLIPIIDEICNYLRKAAVAAEANVAAEDNEDEDGLNEQANVAAEDSEDEDEFAVGLNEEAEDSSEEVANELEQGWFELCVEIILNIQDLKLSEYRNLNIVMKTKIFKACIKKYLISCLEDRNFYEDNQQLIKDVANSMGNIVPDEELYSNIENNAPQEVEKRFQDELEQARLNALSHEFKEKIQPVIDEEARVMPHTKNLERGVDGMPTTESQQSFATVANFLGYDTRTAPLETIDIISEYASPHGRNIYANNVENIPDPFCNFVFRMANYDNLDDIVEEIYNSFESYNTNKISINTDTITNDKTILGMLYEIIRVYSDPFLIKKVIYNCLYRPFEIGQHHLNTGIQDELKKIKPNRKRKETDIPSKEEFIRVHSKNIKTLHGYTYQGVPTQNIFLITEMKRTHVGNEFLPNVFLPNERILFRENDPHTVGILCIRMYEKVLREHLYNSLFERMSTFKGFNEIISVEGNQINIVDDPVLVEDSIYDEYLRNNNNEDSLYNQFLRNNNGGKKRTHKNKSLKKNKKGQKNKRTKKNIGKKMTKKVKKNAKKKSKKRSVR
jgi:hypothetical protein